MEVLSAFFESFGGLAIGFLGGALACGLACAGSARGCGLAGEAATGILVEQPGAFGKVLILQILPGTLGLFGLVVWFFALVQMGVFGSAMDPTTLTVTDGLRVACACLPVAIGCFLAGPAQGRVAANAISLIPTRPNDWTKGILLCITVEFYAILFLLASFLMLLNLHLGAN